MSDEKDNDKGSLFDLIISAVGLIAGAWLVGKVLKSSSEKKSDDTAKIDQPEAVNQEVINTPKEASAMGETKKKKKCPFCGNELKLFHPNECSYCGAKRCEVINEDGKKCGRWVRRGEYIVCSFCDKIACKKCAYDDNFCSSECESTYN